MAQKWLTFAIRQLRQKIQNLALDPREIQFVNKRVIVEESEQIFLKLESDKKGNNLYFTFMSGLVYRIPGKAYLFRLV